MKKIRKIFLKKLLNVAFFSSLFFFEINFSYSKEATPFIARPDYIIDYNKPFNQYTWLVSHNAFSNDTVFSNQYGKSIAEQLQLGARGFMLDLYDYHGSIYLCHKTCVFGNYGTFVETMNQTIIPFLKNNPTAILTIFLEDHTSRENLKIALNKINNLEKYIFTPQKWYGYTNWPTLNEMIQKDQRLIFISENEKNSGYYEIESGEVHIIFGQDINVENYWSLGNTVMSHDYSCKSRWNNIPISAKSASPFYYSWDRLFVMNHFHGVPLANHSEIDNSFSVLMFREERYCKPAAQKIPNYIAVDNITRGDALEYIEWHNNGGILFYAKINEELVKVICGIGTNLERQVPLNKIGCQKNIITGAQLNGVSKGTRIILYRNVTGDRNDDFAVIDIKQDIKINFPIKISTFENSSDNSFYSIRYYGNKGLDRKVSLIDIEKIL
jgi:hypothetical protein